MLEEPDLCYQALLSRDPRFDGRFYVGVSSTGVYCRPVCRVRPPKPQNCRFFPSAAAAEAAGFRPCLRCRPELAPGAAARDPSARLAHRAAALLDAGAEAAALAARLGVSERHLRRLFAAEFGTSPAALARARRMLLAKRLLTDTSLPVTEIAYAAGFASVRTFESAFSARYRLAANALRKQEGRLRSESGSGLELTLAFRPPFDWQRLLRFLARRSVSGVESVDPAGGAYRRTGSFFGQDGRRHAGWIEVRLGAEGDRLHAQLAPELLPVLPELLARLRHLFDLDCVPHEVEASLGPLAAPRPGLRVPGCFDGFEMAVRAVLGQQISVAAARTLAGRFAGAFGEAMETPWQGLEWTFPSAERIAVTEASAVAALGIAGRRASAIVALARALAEGTLELSPYADVDGTVARLQTLPGIGRWTAEYIALRALRWPDAFPGGDYGVRVALGGVSEAQARRRAEAWRPWRSYAVIHLWTGLEEGA